MLSVAATKRRGNFILNTAFQLPSPGVVALFGRSGCGKSTLVNIIAGLLAPDSGRIALDDAILLDTRRGIDVPPERRRVGYVFQDARLFPHLRVGANLKYAARRAPQGGPVSFDAVVGLLDLAPLMKRRVHGLSGGERQRVAIGRALLSQPLLLLLDEPLAALDRARREEVLPYLENLRDQLAIPIVYVTHNFDEVLRLATHLVVMQEGRVIAQGGLGEMSLDPNLRSLIGPDEVGAIVEGTVLGLDAADRLTRIRVGRGEILVPTRALGVGARMRVQLLARDIIVSTQPSQHLSVRNSLAGVVTHIQSDDATSDIIFIDVGSPIMARITKAATRELGLRPGTPAWALIKAVSLRGHAFSPPISTGSPSA